MPPLITIGIPAKNAEHTVVKCLESVLALNYTTYELIVVNDGSTDTTGIIIEKYKEVFNTKFGDERLKIITTDGVGPSKARNMIIERSAGKYLAFTDADCVVAADWLDELLKPLSLDNMNNLPTRSSWPLYKYKIACVGGDQQSPLDESQFGRYVQGFMKSVGFITGYIKPSIKNAKKKVDDYKKVDHNPTCNSLYPREIFADLGGFVPNLYPGEDVEFDKRMKAKGYILLYNPAAIVRHYRAKTWKLFARMMFNYGKVQAYLVRKFGLFRLIHFEPLILLCGIAVIIWFALPGMPPVKWLMESAGILVLAGYVKFVFDSKNIKHAAVYTGLFIYTLIWWNYGFVTGLFSRSPLAEKVSTSLDINANITAVSR
ncbi:MAG: glycosyltransferase [Elusimicrobiota bacterium]